MGELGASDRQPELRFSTQRHSFSAKDRRADQQLSTRWGCVAWMVAHLRHLYEVLAAMPHVVEVATLSPVMNDRVNDTLAVSNC